MLVSLIVVGRDSEGAALKRDQPNVAYYPLPYAIACTIDPLRGEDIFRMHDDVVLAPGLRIYRVWEIGKLPTDFTSIISPTQQLLAS